LFAAWIPGNGAVIVGVTAEQGGATGTQEWVFAPGASVDGTWGWQLVPGSSSEIVAGSDVLATIDSLGVTINTDPAVTLSFAVTAGAADTTFTISSATVNFPAIWNPLGYASAGVTVTDNDSDGATVTGAFNGKAYQAIYNGGTAWANLVAPVTAVADDTATLNDRAPAAGRVVIPATLTSIQSVFKFKLTKTDSASGTSRFDVIVPEPVSLLLILAALPLVRSRRRA
jgi:hypothetical protein